MPLHCCLLAFAPTSYQPSLGRLTHHLRSYFAYCVAASALSPQGSIAPLLAGIYTPKRVTPGGGVCGLLAGIGTRVILEYTLPKVRACDLNMSAQLHAISLHGTVALCFADCCVVSAGFCGGVCGLLAGMGTPVILEYILPKGSSCDVDSTLTCHCS